MGRASANAIRPANYVNRAGPADDGSRVRPWEPNHAAQTRCRLLRPTPADRLRHLFGDRHDGRIDAADDRSEEHTSELQSLMRISYAVFCLKKKINTQIT